MKHIYISLFIIIFSYKTFADCRLPLVGDIQVAMNIKMTIDKKVGPKRGYTEFMPLTNTWKRSPDDINKLVQFPIVPLYVVIDMMIAPVIPFDNAYKWFVNKGVDAKRAWYEKVSPGWDKKYLTKKGQMLGLILQAYQGKGTLLSKVSKNSGRGLKQTARLIKLHNAVGYKLCRNPQITIKEFTKILKKGSKIQGSY